MALDDMDLQGNDLGEGLAAEAAVVAGSLLAAFELFQSLAAELTLLAQQPAEVVLRVRDGRSQAQELRRGCREGEKPGKETSVLFQVRSVRSSVFVQSVRVLEMDLEEVLAAKLLLADLANDATRGAVAVASADAADETWRGRPAFDVDPVHLQHVGLHEVLVAELLLANLAVTPAQGCWLPVGVLVQLLGAPRQLSLDSLQEAPLVSTAIQRRKESLLHLLQELGREVDLVSVRAEVPVHHVFVALSVSC